MSPTKSVVKLLMSGTILLNVMNLNVGAKVTIQKNLTAQWILKPALVSPS